MNTQTTPQQYPPGVRYDLCTDCNEPVVEQGSNKTICGSCEAELTGGVYRVQNQD